MWDRFQLAHDCYVKFGFNTSRTLVCMCNIVYGPFVPVGHEPFSLASSWRLSGCEIFFGECHGYVYFLAVLVPQILGRWLSSLEFVLGACAGSISSPEYEHAF